MRSTLPTLAITLLLAACGADDAGPPAGGADPAAGGATSASEATAAEEPSVGTLRFTVDGAERTFDYLPDSENVYVRLSSIVRAQPEPGSTEALQITFLSLDLKGHTYPAELPPPKDITQNLTPAQAMATVGFSYVDPNGDEWAGPGKIRIESFDNDGVLRGSFDQVEIPHTDGAKPEVTLGAGSFRAKITAPW
ncbi:MAG TPA: hypothetical protein VMV46_07210 [Thermoanaerobaculia bacterium]|nr:hypothetical protein [Thermoanaerobaculia bacterium]